MKGVASGLRETITERCVWARQKHSEAVNSYSLTVMRESVWHFGPQSCGVLVSRCRHLWVRSGLFLRELLPPSRARTRFLFLVSNFPLASPLHLNVTNFQKPQQRKPSVYFWHELFSLSYSAISHSHQALGDFDVDILQYCLGGAGGKWSTLRVPQL